MGNSCGSQREPESFSLDEYSCQKVECQLRFRNADFEELRGKLLRLAPDSDLSQAQLEEFLTSIGVDLELEYRNPSRPFLPFLDCFFDYNTQEYRKDMLLECALLMSGDPAESKQKWLWQLLEKHPGVVFYPQLENAVITLLEISVVTIPALAKRFDNELGARPELDQLGTVKNVEQYARKLLASVRADETGINDRIDSGRFWRFMQTFHGKALLASCDLRRFVLKLQTPDFSS